MKRNQKHLAPCITLAVALVFPLVFSGNNTVIRLGAVSLLYGILAVSLNLISGVAGQISMGHVAFYGIGAYVSAMLSMRAQFPFLLCLLCAFALSAVAGLIIGIPSLRLQGGHHFHWLCGHCALDAIELEELYQRGEGASEHSQAFDLWIYHLVRDADVLFLPVLPCGGLCSAVQSDFVQVRPEPQGDQKRRHRR